MPILYGQRVRLEGSRILFCACPPAQESSDQFLGPIGPLLFIFFHFFFLSIKDLFFFMRTDDALVVWKEKDRSI